MTAKSAAPGPDWPIERIETLRLDLDVIRRKGCAYEVVHAVCGEALSLINDWYAKYEGEALLRARVLELEKELVSTNRALRAARARAMESELYTDD